MEILSYVLEGELEHTDSLGNTHVIKPGVVQVMSAGTGIRHGESNPSRTESVHFLQVWILPDKKGVPPRYEDRMFTLEQRRNRLCLLASPDGMEGSVSIHQDARMYATVLDAGQEISLDLAPGRAAWVQVAKGEIALGHGFGKGKDGMERAGEWTKLRSGDGAALEGETRLVLRAETEAEALVFNLV
jgi:redox-sensitive bicupin YhaK (pirin superfamily)